MRKQDYATLADIIKVERTFYANDKRVTVAQYLAVHIVTKAIAERFVQRTSVNKAEFLKACGIE